MTTDQQPVSDRAISMSVREARMYVGRILLTCGLPSGYAPAVTECVLTSQAAGCGGFAALLQCHAQLRMTEFSGIGVAEIDVHASFATLHGATVRAPRWRSKPTRPGTRRNRVGSPSQRFSPRQPSLYRTIHHRAPHSGGIHCCWRRWNTATW